MVAPLPKSFTYICIFKVYIKKGKNFSPINMKHTIFLGPRSHNRFSCGIWYRFLSVVCATICLNSA